MSRLRRDFALLREEIDITICRYAVLMPRAEDFRRDGLLRRRLRCCCAYAFTPSHDVIARCSLIFLAIAADACR